MDKGSVINLVSDNLSEVENEFYSFLNILSSIIFMVGATIILIVRLGWPGIIGVVVAFVSVPISDYVASKNGEILEKIEEIKDKRVEVTS